MSVYLYRSEGPFPTLDPVIGLGQVAGLPFEKLNDSHFNLGFTIDRVWVKVRITNLSHASQSRMLETGQRYMRPLIVYEQRRPGNMTRLLYNDQFQSFSERPVDFRDLTLPLDFAPGETKTLFLYVGSGGELALNLTLSTPMEVINRNFLELARATFFLGTIFVLMLLSLFKFNTYRDPVYLIYSAHLIAVSLYFVHLDGFTFQFLWPDSPRFNAVCSRLLAHINNLMLLALAYRLFNLRTLEGYFRYVMTGSLIVSGICVLLILIINPQFSMQISVLNAGILGFSMMMLSFFTWLRNIPGAVYLMVSWFGACMVMSWVGLGIMGVISETHFSIAPLKFAGISHALLTYIALTTHSGKDPGRQYNWAADSKGRPLALEGNYGDRESTW
ncbi:MAG: hypothetical protein KDI36_12705 [Pseudomonadales bacterium]|nr:hypothetical protein [Pseudomonadales bacterium]